VGRRVPAGARGEWAAGQVKPEGTCYPGPFNGQRPASGGRGHKGPLEILPRYAAAALYARIAYSDAP
jgi:hypothetical protein